jgi:hypothetical protein
MASIQRMDLLRNIPKYKKMRKPEDLAVALAKEDGYVAVVEFDHGGVCFAGCRTAQDLEEIVGDPTRRGKTLRYCIPALLGTVVSLKDRGVITIEIPKGVGSLR